jgi:hypothetical protein
VDFTGANYAHKKRVPNQTEPFPTTTELRELYDSQNNICGICDYSFKTFHLDHIVQLQFGGAHVLENLRFTHPWCNLSRDRTIPGMVTVLYIRPDTGETDAQPW